MATLDPPDLVGTPVKAGNMITADATATAGTQEAC